MARTLSVLERKEKANGPQPWPWPLNAVDNSFAFKLKSVKVETYYCYYYCTNFSPT